MRKKNSKNYFTKETEDYIVKYNNCEDPVERNRIFTTYLYYPFYKLAENIIHTWKFYHTDVDSLEDLKLDLITLIFQEKISKFDPSRGSKAFSYFGTIIKRHLIAYCNENYDRQKNNLPIENYENSFNESKEIETSSTITLSGFIDNWVEDMSEQIPLIFKKTQEQQIANALLLIFKNRQNIDILQKKSLYFYVREITGYETPYITKVLKVLKQHYYKTYQDLIDEGIILQETSE